MSEFDLLITGGTVVTADSSTKCDIAVKYGRIASLGSNLCQAAYTNEASCRLVLPGGVDSHCHIEQLAASGLINGGIGRGIDHDVRLCGDERRANARWRAQIERRPAHRKRTDRWIAGRQLNQGMRDLAMPSGNQKTHAHPFRLRPSKPADINT